MTSTGKHCFSPPGARLADTWPAYHRVQTGFLPGSDHGVINVLCVTPSSAAASSSGDISFLLFPLTDRNALHKQHAKLPQLVLYKDMVC